MTFDKIVVYEGHDIVKGCKLALKHRLFVGGWSLRDEYKICIEDKTGRLALLFKDGIPVASMLQVEHYNGKSEVQAFTRSTYRRKGYGTLCYEALGFPKASCGPGVDGSENFWKKVGLMDYFY